MRLGAEVEEVRLVRRVEQLLHEVVDGRLVREIGELHMQSFTQVPDVVQRAARGRAHESVHIRVEVDEGFRQVGAHEAVGAGDEAGPPGKVLAELPSQIREGIVRPGGVVSVCFHAAVPADEQVKGSPTRGRSAVRSGAFTGLSYVILSLAAAVAGAYLAHKFGRDKKTDGFMAAYGVYLVLVLGAQSFRMVVVPDLTRAEAEGRLGSEFRGSARLARESLPPSSRRAPPAGLSAMAPALRRGGAACDPGAVPDGASLRRRNGRGQRDEPLLRVPARRHVHQRNGVFALAHLRGAADAAR